MINFLQRYQLYNFSHLVAKVFNDAKLSRSKFFKLISLWHFIFTDHKFWQFRFDWWNGKRLLHLFRNQVNQIKWQNLAPNLSMWKASLKAKTRNTNLSDQLEGNQCRIRGCHSRPPTHPLPYTYEQGEKVMAGVYKHDIYFNSCLI